jgi:transcription elongation GreA/GreB family factor
MKFPDKRRVLDEVIASMSATLAQLTHAAEEIRQDAIHQEAKPENDKDTRALEQTYLARGQAIRAESLIEQLQFLRTLTLPSFGQDDAIRAGALIALEEEEAIRCVFLVSYGGGIGMKVDDVLVTVVTPVSGLGRALLGRRVGDEVEVRIRNGMRAYTIVAIA